MSERVRERRQRTIDEIVDAAIAVMAEGGAPELSLGRIAKRLGMRTPSLYGYFPSKAALCDEIFARGWRELATVMEPHFRATVDTPDLEHRISAAISAFVGWALEHRAAAELMFWRPIAAWEPSPEAYAAALQVTDQLGGWVRAGQDSGALDSAADADEIADIVMTLTSGLITQQLANQPGAALTTGRFTARIDALAAMFLGHYAAPTSKE